jgi:hypothetical protein
MSQHEVEDDVAIEEDAPEGVSLEQAAEIEAFLAVLTNDPRDVILGRFDVDEERWGNARKVWAERIEDEVMRAAAPGQRLPAADRYPLSIRYSTAYSKAAERARDGAMESEQSLQLEAGHD